MATRNYLVANLILWASAILASAILHATTSLTIILLPILATTSLVIGKRKQC